MGKNAGRSIGEKDIPRGQKRTRSKKKKQQVNRRLEEGQADRSASRGNEEAVSASTLTPGDQSLDTQAKVLQALPKAGRLSALARISQTYGNMHVQRVISRIEDKAPGRDESLMSTDIVTTESQNVPDSMTTQAEPNPASTMGLTQGKKELPADMIQRDAIDAALAKREMSLDELEILLKRLEEEEALEARLRPMKTDPRKYPALTIPGAAAFHIAYFSKSLLEIVPVSDSLITILELWVGEELLTGDALADITKVTRELEGWEKGVLAISLLIDLVPMATGLLSMGVPVVRSSMLKLSKSVRRPASELLRSLRRLRKLSPKDLELVRDGFLLINRGMSPRPQHIRAMRIVRAKLGGGTAGLPRGATPTRVGTPTRKGMPRAVVGPPKKTPASGTTTREGRPTSVGPFRGTFKSPKDTPPTGPKHPSMAYAPTEPALPGKTAKPGKTPTRDSGVGLPHLGPGKAPPIPTVTKVTPLPIELFHYFKRHKGYIWEIWPGWKLNVTYGHLEYIEHYLEATGRVVWPVPKLGFIDPKNKWLVVFNPDIL